MMDESGISIGFDMAEIIDDDILQDSSIGLSLEVSSSLPEDIEYHELKSRTLPDPERKPTFKTSTPLLRTDLKQQLQREQWQEQKRKNEEHLSQEKNEGNTKSLYVPINRPIQSIELPEQVLKVKTGLENPTKYHMRQKQKNQVIQYLSSSQQDQILAETSSFKHRKIERSQVQTVQSAPTVTQNQQKSPNYKFVPSPDIYSQSISSVATSTGTSDIDDFNFDELLALEEAQSNNQIDIETFLSRNSSTTSLLKIKSEYNSDIDVKERIKKDNHNMIEKKRRFNINDRIKDLGGLLPKPKEPHYDLIRDNKQSKGTILTLTVDYVKALKEDSQKLSECKEQIRKLEQLNRQFLLRIQTLELQAKKQGLTVPDSIWQIADKDALINTLTKSNTLPNQHMIYNKMPDVVCEVNHMDDEDDNVIHNDRMLSSPLSPQSDPDVDMC